MYSDRHNDISQLQRLIAENHNAYEQLIIVTKVSSAWMAMKLIFPLSFNSKRVIPMSSLCR